MRTDPAARSELDTIVARAMARHHVAEPARSGLYYELLSHIHSAAEKKASDEGRGEVTVGDVRAAVLDMGGEEALAAAFVAPMAREPERATVGVRTAAFLVDVVLLWLVLGTLSGLLDFLLFPFDGTLGHRWFDAGAGWSWFAGFWIVALAYFASAETILGATIGKRALELRVRRADGGPIGWREGLVRNIAKIFPPLLFLDTLILLLAEPTRRQRGSDRIAGTIVTKEG